MAISYQERVRGTGPRKTKRFTATVRRDGISISATFTTKDLAQSWAVKCQDAIVSSTERGIPFDREKWIRRGRAKTLKELHDDIERLMFAREPDLDPVPRPEWTLGRALEHYRSTVTPGKKSHESEEARIDAWLRRPIAGKRLTEVTPVDVQTHINARVQVGRAATTIRNEVFLLSGLYRHAASLPPPLPVGGEPSGWGLTGLANPVTTVRLPDPPPHRNRRLQDSPEPDSPGEEVAMKEALAAGPHADIMVPLFVAAVETGMRLGELLRMRPEQILSVDGVRHVVQPDSKNGQPRLVVLSSRAWAAMEPMLKPARTSGRPLFPLGLHQVEYRWRLARKAAKVTGLKFHDLRHEGLSRMANKGLTIGELQAQGGHRTAEVLLRYINARLPEVARKLG